ncbi:MAG TPA: hypothetical protein VJL90_02540 [Pseudorhodoplanes sp.]|nr:hypothetical protein [Pseudorhodoplanes sp.]
MGSVVFELPEELLELVEFYRKAENDVPQDWQFPIEELRTEHTYQVIILITEICSCSTTVASMALAHYFHENK